MYYGMINQVIWDNSDEAVKKTIEHIDNLTMRVLDGYEKIQDSNVFWKLPFVDKKYIYKEVFRSLKSVFGIFEQTKTYYELRQRTDASSEFDCDDEQEANNV